MTSQSHGNSPFYTLIELWNENDRKIGVNTLREWARSGRIRTVKVGRKYLVPKSELERLAEIAEEHL